MPEDQIFGIRYGLRGFLDRHAKPVQLSRATVDGIQLKGGTVLVRAAYGWHSVRYCCCRWVGSVCYCCCRTDDCAM